MYQGEQETFVVTVKSAQTHPEKTSYHDEVAQRMEQHLRNNTTDTAPAQMRVPIANFISDAHAEAERALFRRLPLIAAISSELPKPGDFLTKTLLGVSVLLVRQSNGQIGAFYNMCRHRGGKVELEEKGNKGVFVCRYHGWSYERDGALRGVPFEETFGAVDRTCNHLHRIRAEERHGFIWLDFSNDESRTVADFLGAELDAEMATLGLESAVVFLDKPIHLDVNWKLIVDGATDMLHPQFLHPDGVGKLIETHAVVWKDYGRHGQLFGARKKFMKLINAGQQVDAPWKYFATNLIVYPNSIIITAPDHIEFWSIWPDDDSAKRAMVQIRFLVRREKLNDEIAKRLNQSWEILSHAAQNEDFPMEVSIQANAHTQPDGAFVYGRNEVTTQHLHRELRKDVGDAAG